jgi:hypothetical protein
MIKWLLRRWVAKFERTWNYANYLREVLDGDSRALATSLLLATQRGGNRDNG